MLESCHAQPTPWYFVWGIVYDFLPLVTHSRIMARPLTSDQASAFPAAVLASPSLGILAETDRHRHAAAEVLGGVPGISGNLVFNAHSAILVRENGVRSIYTRDTDLKHFPSPDTIDSVTETRHTRRVGEGGRPRR